MKLYILNSLMLLAVSSPSDASHPHSWSPSISLRDSASEPDGNGFCPDIVGFRASLNCESLQGHSCKPSGDDTQFAYSDDASAPYIYAVNYGGDCTEGGGDGCMTVDGDIVEGASLKLAQCDNLVSQRFAYTSTGQFKIANSEEASAEYLCLAVGELVRPAGPFWGRDLLLMDCDMTDAALTEWVVDPAPTFFLEEDLEGMISSNFNNTNSTLGNISMTFAN